jgi:hypothetical protein
MTGSQAHYRAFELNWHCQGLAIPELPGCSMEALAGADPLIAIEPEEPDHWPQLEPGPHDTPFLQMARGDLRLTVDDIGRFRITDGVRIAWHRQHSGVSDQDISTFLLGSAVGALLIQRGSFVLHGNALEKTAKPSCAWAIPAPANPPWPTG